PYALELAIHHSPFGFFYSGTAAVYIFFVLSGYVLTYSIVNSQQPRAKIKAMTLKRLPRLMLPALGSCLLLWLAFYSVQPDGQYVSEWLDALGSEVTGSEIASSGISGSVSLSSLTDALYDGVIRTFWYGWSQYNWVLWTMKFELVGSLLVFGLLYARYVPAKTLNRMGLESYVARFVLMTGLLIFLLILSYVSLRMTPFDLDSLAELSVLDIVENTLELVAFLLGMLLFFYYQVLSELMNDWLACTLLALGLYCAGVHDSSVFYRWLNPWLDGRTYNLLNFIAGPLIVMAVLMNTRLAGLCSTKIPVYLGRISFAAYLNHLLIIYVVGLPLFNLLYQWQLSYATSALISCAAVIGMTIVFSEVYYRVVDQNTLRFSAWLAHVLIRPKSTEATEATQKKPAYK
ncbi:MAG: acyltransferase, partial [Moraxellaceae bacterium]